MANEDPMNLRHGGSMGDAQQCKGMSREAIQQLEACYRTLFESARDAIFLMRAESFVDCNPAALLMFGCPRQDIIGQTPVHFSPAVQPDGRDSAEVANERIRAAYSGVSDSFEWRHRRPDGAEFDAEVSLNRVDLDQKPFLLAVVRDITLRKRAQEETRRRTAEAVALNSLSHAVSSSLSVDHVVANALGSMVQAVKADIAFLFSRDGERLVLAGVEPPGGSQWLGKVEHRVGKCLCGTAITLERPCYSKDIHQDLRCTREECKQAGVRSAAVLPLRGSGGIIGVIGIASLTPRDFQQQSEFLETLANTVSVGLQNAQLFAQSKRTQDALRESEAQLRTLADGIEAAIAIVQGTRFVYANPFLEKISGYSMSELLSVDIRQLIHAAFRELVVDRAQKRQSGQPQPNRYEFKMVTKGGEERWIDLSVGLIDYKGHPAIIGAGLDITERKQAQEALRSTADRLSAIIQASPQPIIAIDTEGRVVFWSPAAQRVFGWSESEVLGRPLPYVPAEKLQEHLGIRARAMSGQVASFEVARRKKDGSEIILNIFVAPLRDAGGKIIGVMAVHSDVTDRRRAQEALRISEEQLRQAARVAGLGIFDHDHGTGEIHWSAEMRKMCGWDADAKIGLPAWIKMIHPEDRDTIAQAIRAAHDPAGDGRYSVEHRILRHDDGSERWVSVRSQTFFRGQGATRRPIRTIGATLDITDRKQAEETLKALNVSLEERVTQRTALAEHRAAQLRELASRLTQTERTERRRVAHILHEHFQQLLFAANLQLARLKGQLGDRDLTDIAEDIQHILAEGIEASRSLAVELCPPVLYEMGLLPALNWLAGKMKDKCGLGVEVKADLAAEPATDAMKTLLFESASELLFNVAKHAKVQEATVRVKRLADGVELTVADQGVGFDPAQLSAKGSAAGGFGLFSIRERLELVEGRIEIDSACGRGSRFRIWVPDDKARVGPRKAPVAPVVSATGQASPVSARSGAARGKIRVLLVDDHAIVRRGIALAMKQAPDIEIAGEATDGREAVDLVREILPDVVLMDISMPGMDGFEATRLIHQEFPDVRVVGLSMFEESEQSAAMLKAGASAYLTKSGDFEALLATIRAWGPTGAANEMCPS